MELTYLDSKAGFLGLESSEAGSPEDARAVVIPFGLEATVSYGGGTAQGPQAVLAASHQVELFDERLWREAYRDYGVATLAEPVIATQLPAALEQIEATVEAVLQAGRFPLVVGGEHSLTAGAIRPFVRRWPTLNVLHFDAHADLRDSYEGERFSHASAIRRVLDHPGVRVVSVGIRNLSAEEATFLDANPKRVDIFWARDRSRTRPQEVLDALAPGPVYVSIDVDGFDASLMPATGTPEPGGLFWDDVLPILERVGRERQVVGADIVELAPIELLPACNFLVAKLAYQLLNVCLSRAAAGAVTNP